VTNPVFAGPLITAMSHTVARFKAPRTLGSGYLSDAKLLGRDARGRRNMIGDGWMSYLHLPATSRKLAHRSPRGAAFAAALLGLSGIAAFVAPVARAAEPLRVFNIDVYVLNDPGPECRNLEPALSERVGSFQPDTSIAEIIEYLTTKTLARGGNALHSIRIHQGTPGGLDVSGIAANCEKRPSVVSDRPLLPFEAGLIETVRAANEARAFSFPESGRFGPMRSVSTVPTVPRSLLSAAQLAMLKSIVLSPDTYAPQGLVTSCAFEPNVGVQLKTSAAEAWWLLSSACQIATLVRADTSWRTTQIIPITEAAMQRLTALMRELGLAKLPH
jgi:hypothetical protein